MKRWTWAVVVGLGTVTTAQPTEVVERVIGAISPDRIAADIERLVSFGTRHTLSDTESDTRGIGAARRWILAEFERVAAASGREGDEAVRAYFDPHAYEPDGRRVTRQVDVVNVVCEIPGTMPEARARRYYVIGHYDSRASGANDAESDAPGANDDASGTVVAIELARVLAKERLDSTVILMPTAGEEQGLLGARAHARAARENGLDIRAVLSNDIVGDPTGPGGEMADHLIRVFSEGIPAMRDEATVGRIRALAAESDSDSRQLARYLAEVGEWYDLPVRPKLVFRPDRFGRGGDHSPFNENGFPAVRFTEVYENYNRQHQDVRVENGVQYGDLPEYVDREYVANVARLNAAAIVCMANAPSIPQRVRIITAQLGNETALRWDASPEPDVAGYEIVWRDTTSPFWQHSLDAGNVLAASVNVGKDDHYFGVRAYDHDGYRSPVAFAGASPR